jgi:HAE1 family hydrophobic/amphiphilic exporter-1
LELKIRSTQKESLETLKKLHIRVSNREFVPLKDVVTFHKFKSFEKIIKDSGEKNFYVYANVDSKKIIAIQTLQKLEQPIKEEKKDDIIDTNR